MRTTSSFVVLSFLLLAGDSYALGQRPLDEGLGDLAAEISTEAGASRRVAVVPFRELNERPSVLGAFLAEELTTRLYKTRKHSVVERSLLDKVFQEQKLGELGLIDPDGARRLGKLVGAMAIVTGTVASLDSYVAINCRLIDTETGAIFAAAQTKVFKDANVQKILGLPLDLERPGVRPTSPSAAPKSLSAEDELLMSRFPTDKQDGHVSPLLASIVPLRGTTRRVVVLGITDANVNGTGVYTHAIRARSDDGSSVGLFWLDELAAIKNTTNEDFVVQRKDGTERKLLWTGANCQDEPNSVWRCSFVVVANPDGTREVIDMPKIRAIEFR